MQVERFRVGDLGTFHLLVLLVFVLFDMFQPPAEPPTRRMLETSGAPVKVAARGEAGLAKGQLNC
jgi:hypothetical protein